MRLPHATHSFNIDHRLIMKISDQIRNNQIKFNEILSKYIMMNS